MIAVMHSFLWRTPRVLVIQETSGQSGRDKLRGIFNYAHLYGPWHIYLVHGRAGETKPSSRTDWANFDGILVGQMMLDLAAALTRIRTPIVLMDPLDEAIKHGTRFARYSRTIDDSEQVGKVGAEFLRERGYRHFAYVGEPLNRNWSVQRGESFRRQLENAGFDCHVYPISNRLANWGMGKKQMAHWLNGLPKPVALLAAMDTVAQEIIELCTENGLKVPQDVGVLGIDDDELICNGSIPTISSIRRDTERCGYMAAKMLDSLIRKESRKQNIFKYGVKEIITRDSTELKGQPGDLIALKAREFIRINAGKSIQVPDVVRHLNVSRRLAEIRFRAAFEHSLLEEIQNARLERVEKLLKETELSLTEICTRCGYQTDVHLRRIFKKRYHCSMRDFRKRMGTGKLKNR